MDSIDIAGPPKMETRMVDMLFGQSGQAKADAPAAGSTAVPTVSVGSGAKSAVSSSIGQAIAALHAGGADAGSSDRRYMTVAQANALVASNNAMTSAQISVAVYNGKGLQETGPASLKHPLISRNCNRPLDCV